MDHAQESVPAARVEVGTRLAVVLVGVTMVGGVISSLGAPLLPSVARALHVSLNGAQWSLTVALLSASVAAPIMGRLGDGPYRRETILGGLATVFVGSLVAGSAHSLIVLVIGRVLQGVGLGLAPVTMAAARDHLPPDRSPGVIAVLSVAGATAVGAGYPVSGFIATDIGLHEAFFFGAVISGIALVVAALVIPSNRASTASRLDVRGAAVIALGLTSLVLAIGQGQVWGWDSATIIALFLAAAIIIGLWARMQLGRADPLVDLRQLGHRAVLTADLAAIVLGIAMYMFLTVVTEFVQEPSTVSYGLGETVLVAGLCLVPFSVMSLVASRFSAALSNRFTAKGVLVGGSFVIAAAGAFFALLHSAIWEAFVAMAVLGTGFGLTFAALPGLVARSVPPAETGSAMGLYQVVRYVGFALGSAIAASIIASGAGPGGHILESGYVTACWVGTAICAASALATVLLSRGQPAMAVADADSERRAMEDSELGGGGLVGIEGDCR